MKNEKQYDVVIIGGSYAGLAGAMALSRALQNVLIIDSGNPCNKQTPHSHNFLTQDGVTPAAIAALAKEQVSKYPTVSFENDFAVSISGTNNNFEVRLASGPAVHGRKILLSSGVKDLMPDIEGFAQCWGISVIHCPYCHGYEYRGQLTGVLINGDMGAEHAGFLSNWTDQLTIFTNGESTISQEKVSWLQKLNIPVVEKEIVRIHHQNGYLEAVEFKDGTQQKLNALYAKLPFVQHSEIPQQLGCSFNEHGLIKIDQFNKTSVAGVWAAGDAVTAMRSVASAVAGGTLAGAMIARELIFDKFD